MGFGSLPDPILLRPRLQRSRFSISPPSSLRSSLPVALPKQHRLKHRKEFQAVYRHGDRCFSPHLSVRGLKLERGDVAAAPTRIGISISQKVSKRAVIRNRIKRQIAAALQQLIPQISDGWWIVITARSSAVECEYSQFLRELEDTLKKLEVTH